MQLKRDTDYAFRVLYCLNERYKATRGRARRGLTLTEIASRAGIPKTAAERVCSGLYEKGLINLSVGKNHYYSAANHLLNYSLLDVIEAVENTGKIFAVFDRITPMYKSCGEQINLAQEKCEQMLASISVGSLLGK